MTPQHVYSLFLEYSILHTMIVNGYDSVQQSMLIMKNDVNHFYNEQHRLVYQAIIALFNKDKPINILSVFEYLKSVIPHQDILKKTTQSIAKGEVLDDLHDACTQLIDYSVKRKLWEMSNTVKADKLTKGFDMLSQVTDEVNAISTTYLPHNVTDMSIIQQDALAMIRKAKEYRDKGEFAGIPTGFVELDSMMGGMKPGQMIIVAARPAMGKTSFILSTALTASKRHPVAIFSLEMDKETLFIRLASQYTRISLSDMINGNVTDKQIQQISEAMDIIKQERQIIIDDDYLLTATILKAKIRRYIQQYGIQAVFIDYLQLMGTNKGQNREREIAELSQSLKQMAREYNIPIIVLSQLNRELEHRPDKKPLLSDLRESGSLEQDSDIVMMLYRPEYYGIQKYNDGTPTTDTCQINIEKQRNGATGSIVLNYIKQYAGFYNYIAPGILPATNHEPYQEDYTNEYDESRF